MDCIELLERFSRVALDGMDDGIESRSRELQSTSYTVSIGVHVHWSGHAFTLSMAAAKTNRITLQYFIWK